MNPWNREAAAWLLLRKYPGQRRRIARITGVPYDQIQELVGLRTQHIVSAIGPPPGLLLGLMEDVHKYRTDNSLPQKLDSRIETWFRKFADTVDLALCPVARKSARCIRKLTRLEGRRAAGNYRGRGGKRKANAGRMQATIRPGGSIRPTGTGPTAD